MGKVLSKQGLTKNRVDEGVAKDNRFGRGFSINRHLTPDATCVCTHKAVRLELEVSQCFLEGQDTSKVASLPSRKKILIDIIIIKE